MSKIVKIGVVGIGNMGTSHAENIFEGKIEGLTLTAICDNDPIQLDKAIDLFGEVFPYLDYKEMIDSGEVDAVLISTPHYSHPEIAIYAFEHGLNVLCEKPAGVYTAQVEEMNLAAEKAGTVFSLMYNQRARPIYKKLHDMVHSGLIGEPKRLVWIVTSWYRPQSYYDSGTWRATWKGEGGGVLINQCPHNLDLWQWIFGMPKTVHGFCSYGKYHDIEVEDDVTAYAEYENGATATFITTTGESPGTNRLEISGDRGKIVVEDDKIKFWELKTPEREYNRTSKEFFKAIESSFSEIVPDEVDDDHIIILQNFTSAILNGEKLIAPGVEGINGLTISNAIHLSDWLGETVTLPIDKEKFYEILKSKFK